jgi:hypothetical protein
MAAPKDFGGGQHGCQDSDIDYPAIEPALATALKSALHDDNRTLPATAG